MDLAIEPAAAGRRPPSHARSERAARFATWLEPQEIVLDVDVRSRRHALECAAELIGRTHRLDAAPIFRALWRRELVGSTALGCGIAIPHARIDGIPRPLTLYLRTTYAIEFVAPDDKPVSHLLAIMVPAEGDPEEHLNLLAVVAELFAERSFRAALHGSKDAADVRKAFATYARGMARRSAVA